MHVVSLALGLVIIVAGLVLFGWGIVDMNAATFGNAAMISGTIALVGGLGLVGLASAIVQLRRIAQELEQRPLPRPVGAEPTEAARVPPPSVAPPSEPEPRYEPEIERAILGAPAAARTAEEAERAGHAPPAEQPAAGKAAAEPPSPEAARREAAEPAARDPFEAIWSDRSAAGRREPFAEESAEPPRSPGRADEPVASAPTPEVRIFKSGVIDGMAYTLYTDGSIEAELAQGTVTFASIDALRAYLAARE